MTADEIRAMASAATVGAANSKTIAVVTDTATPPAADKVASPQPKELSLEERFEQLQRQNAMLLAVASQKDPAAVEWLRKNVARISEDVRILESDVEDALIGVKCDVVIANPPYIPDSQELPRDVADHEPAFALFGGVDGMKTPRLFISTASRLLKSGGFLALEHHEEQGEAIANVLSDDFIDILLHQDLTGRPRFTTAVRR